MKLYEIDAAIAECIDEEGEVIDFERLMELEIDRREKIDNILCLYKNRVAETAAIENEIKSLNERRTQTKNKAESLKNWLSEILDGEKFDSARNKVTWRKSDEVNILDEKAIPDEYKAIEIKVSKTDVKAAIKSGITVDGCELIHKNNIQIK